MSELDLTGVVLEDRYQVEECLAEGAMGSVWRGERLKLGRAVAIKIMHEELPDELASRERFEREAKLMARLEHPNCVSVIDFGVHDGKPFLVMDLVRGTSLQELIDREKRMEPPRAAEIMKQVLSGLAHAHELGIVHRDIKPANIMVGEKTGIGMQVRILDFGLARPAQTSTKLTTGIVVGTPNYMSPEQCRGGDIDGRVDLYACGVILFEMLVGRKPFLADDPIQVVRMHMNQPPPKLADIVPGDYGDFEAIVARALAKEASARFPTAQDMARALDAAVATKKTFGHAVPQAIAAAAAAPKGPQLATMSGWNVPAESAPSVALATSDLEPISPPAPPNPAPSPPPPSAPPLGADTVRDVDPPLASTSGSAPPVPAAGPTLPFTKKQALIAGGGLLAVIVLIAIVAGGGSSKKASSPAHDAGAAVASAQPPPSSDNGAAVIADANERVAGGDREGALQELLRARHDYPDNAQIPFLLGRIYYAKLYWGEGIRNFRDAIKLDPSLRSDPELIKTALRGFITTPSIERDLESFLHDDIGDAAIPYLEETSKDHPNPTIRARAAAELRRFR